MHHLHMTQSLEPLQGGGLGISTVALHRQFLAMGVESTLCSTHGGTPLLPAERTYEFKRVKPDFLYYAPELRRRAEQLVGQADVVHGHGFYVGTNWLLGREARRQQKPLVYHVHGFFEPWILNRSRWKKRLVHWLFEDSNFRQVRLWRALTTKEAGQIRSLGLTAPIVVVPVGIDPKAYAVPYQAGETIETPLAGDLTKVKPRVVFVSRLHSKKGLDLLLPAWAGLGKLAQQWELIVAGPDEGGYAVVVDGAIQELGLKDSVRRVGKVTHETKVKLLKSADLFVLPSHSEGFTSAILEAMAAGLPVLATRACNFPELFQAGGGWECLPTRDSVQTALREALNASAQERRQRGEAGRQLLERNYTWPRIAERLLDACASHCSAQAG
jgi:glycosyltransferase involved in cell wall biosynthesis